MIGASACLRRLRSVQHDTNGYCLNLSDIIFILGAGASREDGAPLMNDFFDRAHSLHRSGRLRDVEPEFTLVDQARGALQAAHAKGFVDIHNIESVFTALELAKVIERLPTFRPADIERAIVALQR